MTNTKHTMTEEEVNNELDRIYGLMNNKKLSLKGKVRFDNIEVDDLLTMIDVGNKEQWNFNSNT